MLEKQVGAEMPEDPWEELRRRTRQIERIQRALVVVMSAASIAIWLLIAVYLWRTL